MEYKKNKDIWVLDTFDAMDNYECFVFGRNNLRNKWEYFRLQRHNTAVHWTAN
jgi:hypothetical protein